MNQILSVNMPNNKNKKPTQKTDIKTIIIFFAIILILFGAILAVIGVISNNKSSSKSDENIAKGNEPRIDTLQEGTILNIVISSNDEIDKVVYNWNNEAETEVQGNGNKQLELNVNIPEGTNTLKISATDVNGLSQNFEKQYQGAVALEAKIELEQDENNLINIICESESKIESVSYYFDNKEPKKVTVNDYSATIPLDEIEGDHKLTVTVVDIDGKTRTKRADIYMTAITTTLEGDNFIITATNTQGIGTVHIYINGEEKTIEVNDTKYEETIKLKDGQNRIGIVVYDVNEVRTKKIWAPQK